MSFLRHCRFLLTKLKRLTCYSNTKSQTCGTNCFQKPFDIRSRHSTKCTEAETSVFNHYSTVHVLCGFQTFCSGYLVRFTLKLRQINVTANNLKRHRPSSPQHPLFTFLMAQYVPQVLATNINLKLTGKLTDKAFSTAGPRARNALPSNIKLISSRASFRRETQDTLFQSHLVKLLLFQHVIIVSFL